MLCKTQSPSCMLQKDGSKAAFVQAGKDVVFSDLHLPALGRLLNALSHINSPTDCWLA